MKTSYLALPDSQRMRYAASFLVFLSLISVIYPIVGKADEEDDSGDGREATAEVEPGNVLTLEQYLNEVREKHDNYKAAKQSHEGALLTSRESHLILFPSLFGNAQYTDDQRPNLLFHYQKLATTQYQLGVSELTSFGLQGKAYYSLTHTAYTGLLFGGPTPTNISGLQGGATIELTFALWRNWLGSETQLQVEQGDAASSADKYNQSFQMKSILVAAESAYWRLYLARESVKVTEGALERAQKLYQFHEQRSKIGLSNEADFFQADAALQSRRVDLRTARDQEVVAAREFNSARGLNSSAVPERQAKLTLEAIAALQIPKRNAQRDDVQAAAEQVKATEASAELSRQKYLPTVEAYGSAGTNTTDPTNFSFGNSFSGARPTASIGLRVNASLDFGVIDDVRHGWEVKKQSAEFGLRRKQFEQESTWNDLTEKFAQAKHRLVLIEKLIQSQERKLNYERTRRKKGLTTTQQVINFELDFQQAELAKIQTESELLQILAQMKLFGDTYGLR